jgi:hypothetical protein
MQANQVPCNGCTACCKNEFIILQPDDGDVIASYQTRLAAHPREPRLVHVLLKKPNGDCIYLGDGGCTIHDRAPYVCKVYDCRKFLRLISNLPPVERRRVFADPLMKDRLAAGKKRLETLGRGKIAIPHLPAPSDRR